MRFFSKVVFICNCCFVVAVILRLVENAKKLKSNADNAIIFQPLESTLVILGYGAIFINFIFNIMVLCLFLLKREQLVTKWLIWTNFLLLLAQVYYFLFSNFK